MGKQPKNRLKYSFFSAAKYTDIEENMCFFAL